MTKKTTPTAKPIGKPVKKLLPVAEKPLNEWQTKNFLYMLNRMETFRLNQLAVAKREAQDALYKAKPNYSVALLLKELKSGRVKPVTLDGGNNIVTSSTREHIKSDNPKGKYTDLTKVSMFFEKFPHESDYNTAYKKLDDELIKAKLDVHETTAVVRTRLRLGSVSNIDAQAVIEEFMEKWRVPHHIVAQADHTNSNCTR